MGYYVFKAGGSAPTKLHDEYKGACEEAERLAGKFDGEFIVVGAVRAYKGKRTVESYPVTQASRSTGIAMLF